MLNDTWPQYLFIRAVIILLQCIGPACTAYTLQTTLFPLQWPTLTPFRIYCAAEAAFFVFFLHYRTRLQREAIHPPLRSKEERKKLFDRVRSEIHDPAKFLSGWFRGAKIEDIGRENLKEFLSWAFWESRVTADDEKELEEVTAKVERMTGRSFAPGRGKVQTLRPTLDPIEVETRCLLWYGIIFGVDAVCHLRMLVYGMKYYSTFAATWNVFPPRPLAAATAKGSSPAKGISYWLRPHTSKTRLPILFIHGIGVGMHPNVEFLHELDVALNHSSTEKSQDDGQVGILTLEILQICSRLTHSIPTRAEFLAQLTQILDAHDYKRFVLASHSYGSVLSTHMLTDAAMAPRVAATLLIDPVTILLHMPDVAYNFTVRQPKHANEWQLWYFASKDPGVAHTLGRHFFWSENVLWRDRITDLVKNGMPITASLARRDLIVDTPAVAAYLLENEVPDPAVVVNHKTNEKHMALMHEGKEKALSDGKERSGAEGSCLLGSVGKEDWQTRQWKGKGLEVVWWDDLDHAQVFDEKDRRAKLVDILVAYSKGA